MTLCRLRSASDGFDLHRRPKLAPPVALRLASAWNSIGRNHVARRLQVIGKRLVELFGILVRLEEHHIEHDGPGPRLLEVPHDIPITIARPGPAPERLKARFIHASKSRLESALAGIRIAPDEMIQRFQFHHFEPSVLFRPATRAKTAKPTAAADRIFL